MRVQGIRYGNKLFGVQDIRSSMAYFHIDLKLDPKQYEELEVKNWVKLSRQVNQQYNQEVVVTCKDPKVKIVNRLDQVFITEDGKVSEQEPKGNWSEVHVAGNININMTDLSTRKLQILFKLSQGKTLTSLLHQPKTFEAPDRLRACCDLHFLNMRIYEAV